MLHRLQKVHAKTCEQDAGHAQFRPFIATCGIKKTVVTFKAKAIKIIAIATIAETIKWCNNIL